VKTKFHPGNQAIVHFVDLIETKKKVYEVDSPKSLLGPVRVKLKVSTGQIKSLGLVESKK